MSPEAAKIFHVDDDHDFSDTQREFLENKGHKVVLSASTRS